MPQLFLRIFSLLRSFFLIPLKNIVYKNFLFLFLLFFCQKNETYSQGSNWLKGYAINVLNDTLRGWFSLENWYDNPQGIFYISDSLQETPVWLYAASTKYVNLFHEQELVSREVLITEINDHLEEHEHRYCALHRVLLKGPKYNLEELPYPNATIFFIRRSDSLVLQIPCTDQPDPGNLQLDDCVQTKLSALAFAEGNKKLANKISRSFSINLFEVVASLNDQEQLFIAKEVKFPNYFSFYLKDEQGLSIMSGLSSKGVPGSYAMIGIGFVSRLRKLKSGTLTFGLELNYGIYSFEGAKISTISPSFSLGYSYPFHNKSTLRLSLEACEGFPTLTAKTLAKLNIMDLDIARDWSIYDIKIGLQSKHNFETGVKQTFNSPINISGPPNISIISTGLFISYHFARK